MVIFVFITKFFRLFPPSTPPTSMHVFLFWKTGPHTSEEKVVHYFIPTFSLFWHLWGLLCPEVLPLKLDHQINYHSSLLSKYEWQWMTTGKANFQLWFVIGKANLFWVPFPSPFLSLFLPVSVFLFTHPLSLFCAHSRGSSCLAKFFPLFSAAAQNQIFK